MLRALFQFLLVLGFVAGAALFFGSATLFFLWVMFAFDTAPQYKMFMAALVAICGLVALFGPIVLAKEERA